ncbi:DNA ligase D [Methylophilus methylotrophus]|uniref:DNA ligase D n=1 Tax=Methylophilus methylotrophus TaxID=17 RepID=UPI000F592108|nr:DNA ligase D [Methylophilus methylotrophus]
MGLQQYWKKRDFNVTQEPRGKVEASGQQLKFFIQKHHARRLHYDFRLELQGTLKSWAVPKGPSLDPHDKRLAVEVEDHPLAYGSFEGDIPAGQYGAGHVMLWDKGTWEAIGDPVQGYKDGSLKFQLHGHKLHGKWALVRMKGRHGHQEKQTNWLLIKEQDDEARNGHEANITETQAESVRHLRETSVDSHVSKRVVQDRGANVKDIGISANLKKALKSMAKTRMPTAYQPQLATLVTHAPEGEQWLSELKYDGYRALTQIHQGKVKMFSRNGHDWSAKWPALVKALSAVPAGSAWLDGEVVAIQADGSISFQALQNAVRLGKEANLAYFIFDLLYLDGHDVTHLPLRQRKELLQALLGQLTASKDNPLHYSDHMAGHAQEAFNHACLHGLEGIIVKHADSPYQQQRSRDWLKVKCGQRQEFVIGGYTEPAGSRELFGALLLGNYDEKGGLRYAGRVGTGFKQDTLKLVAKHFASLRTEKTAFINPPRGQDARGVHWLKPSLVAEIKFAQWTDEGIVRHASFVGLRSDKPAKEITHEIAQSAEELGRQSIANTSVTKVAGVPLSKPAKVLFAEDGYTKLDIAHHYEALAQWILPYLRNRPLSIVRCPDGYHHHCFFQKHVTKGSHEHVQSVQLDAAGKQPEYFIANSLPAVIELVQLGVLELHAWGACYPKTGLADRLIFDLDPAPDVPWERVTEAALLLRGLFEELKLTSFVKTTGGKGLHVEVPIKPEHPWEVIKAFSHGVAQHIETQIPDRFTSNLSKKKREGRIFIDYLRNGTGATAVVPYSTRAKLGAPVATPLHWQEVGPDSHSNTFTISNIGQRLTQLESDPWQDYLALQQKLSNKIIKLFTG